MKYLGPCVLFLLGNEIVTLIALMIMTVLFFMDIAAARMEER